MKRRRQYVSELIDDTTIETEEALLASHVAAEEEECLFNDANGWAVAVHAGAGWHSTAREPLYQRVCRRACLAAGRLLARGSNAAEAASRATVILEAASCTNAGRGSCLALDGSIELDAAVADSMGGFGAVGALKGVRSAVSVALDLLKGQQNGARLSLGRLPPQFLVGEGARLWAMQRGHEAVRTEALYTSRTLKAHKLYSERLLKKQSANSADLNGPLDTVGAVCIDANGCLAAACSSGGLSLKQPGRVGQAAQLGAGLWASNSAAAVTSGTGEHLVRTQLAHQAVSRVSLVEPGATFLALHECLVEDFVNAPALKVESDAGRCLDAGVLLLRRKEVVFAHTTRSMAVGVWSSSGMNRQPTTLISRKDVNTAVCVGELCVD